MVNGSELKRRYLADCVTEQSGMRHRANDRGEPVSHKIFSPQELVFQVNNELLSSALNNRGQKRARLTGGKTSLKCFDRFGQRHLG